MATYFNKYYFEFYDIHITSPIRWRVDIMDSQGNTPTEPYLLTPAAQPLVIERVDTSDDKFTTIVGRQITVSYMYIGNPNEPLPDEFFEADERRFRIEVRKNGVLDGVYYVKPDFSEYPDVHAPFIVKLKAIDGLGYSKGTLFNAYDETGLLYYQKIPFYEAIATRALFQIFDDTTVINVLQSLVPNGASPGDHLLFDSYIHTDIFYSFVEGPKSVYDVLYAFCKAFNARLITEGNAIWITRIQDLSYSSYTIDQYISDSVVNTLSLPDFIKTAGGDTSFDSIPINLAGSFVMMPAVKKAEFEVEYRAINQVSNFLWVDYDGTDFDDWVRALGDDPTPPIGREGNGTIEDPYRALLPYGTNEFYYINQGFFLGTPYIPVKVGDIVQIEMFYRFDNTKSFGVLIAAEAELSGNFYHLVLDQSGSWIVDPGGVGLNQKIRLVRSGKKREGSFKIDSLPLPRVYDNSGTGYPTDMKLQIFIFYPAELSDTSDGPVPQQISLSPIKVGVIALSSKGRRIRATNQANFSQVKEVEKFTFIDTGEDGLSNTIFTGPSQTPEDGGWESPKPGVTPGDIERQMAIGVIDQYQRSVNSWNGDLYSNSLAFYNPIRLNHKPDKLFMQSADNYDVRSCIHATTLVEVFEEGTADYDILEYDIEDAEE